MGSTPEGALDLRDGDIAFSKVIPTTTSTGLKWFAQGQPNNFPSSGRYQFCEIQAYQQWQGGNIRFFTKAYNSTSLLQRMIIAQDGRVGIGGSNNPTDTLQVSGSFSAVSKAFDIPHPDPAKPGWRLRHSCIETPSCGGVQYKFQLACQKGDNTFEVPTYIQHLAKDLLCFCSPFKCLGQAWAEVNGSTLHVVTSKVMTCNVLIFGDRCDKDAQECDRPIEYPAPPET